MLDWALGRNHGELQLRPLRLEPIAKALEFGVLRDNRSRCCRLRWSRIHETCLLHDNTPWLELSAQEQRWRRHSASRQQKDRTAQSGCTSVRQLDSCAARCHGRQGTDRCTDKTYNEDWVAALAFELQHRSICNGIAMTGNSGWHLHFSCRQQVSVGYVGMVERGVSKISVLPRGR